MFTSSHNCRDAFASENQTSSSNHLLNSEVDILISEQPTNLVVKCLKFDLPLFLFPDHRLPEVHPVGQQVLSNLRLRLQLHVAHSIRGDGVPGGDIKAADR